MLLKELKDHWEDIREELNALPIDVFISDKVRPVKEWEGSDVLSDIISEFSAGKHGWVHGTEFLKDTWISWPLIWEGNTVLGNCLKCPKTFGLLSQIEGIYVAGFSLMKGGVKIQEHSDIVGANYNLTYHLGLKCPDGCYLHHQTLGDVKEEDGKHIVMNARYPHWAENTSQEDRVILYIEHYTSTMS
jgi:hypothetical protein